MKKTQKIKKTEKKRSDSKELAKKIALAAASIKAVDIKVLDLDGLSGFTDFFVICSGTSSRHVLSVADRITERMKKDGAHQIGMEGHHKGEWVLIDYGGVVAHVFHPEAREFFGIEKFWKDAKKVRFTGIKG